MNALIAGFLLVYFDAGWGWWVWFLIVVFLDFYGSVK